MSQAVGIAGKWMPAGVFCAVAAFAVFWWLTMPGQLTGKRFDELQATSAHQPDLSNGESVFWAGGCASCHAAKGAKGEDKKRLGGGHRLDTPAGIFVAPNISPDTETGIGKWSLLQFANAMLNGVSPKGDHYYPSFPYPSYTRMTIKDVSDLFSYLRTLPPIVRENEPHELSILFGLRRGIGIWKLVFLRGDAVIVVPNSDPVLKRGRYLVESLGHCGECHTSRTALGFGGLDASNWLAGGPSPEGRGRIPNITPHKNALGGWSADEITDYLETGFTPDFDSVGGSMVSVQENLSKLPKADLTAIAAYLKSVPEVGPVSRPPR